jgi:hypothetical protein
METWVLIENHTTGTPSIIDSCSAIDAKEAISIFEERGFKDGVVASQKKLMKQLLDAALEAMEKSKTQSV